MTSEDTAASIGTRTSYFREEYAYGENLLLDGVEVMREPRGPDRRGARASTAGR